MLTTHIETAPEITPSESKAALELFKLAILNDNSEKVKELLDKGFYLDRYNSEIWSYIFIFDAYKIAKLLVKQFEPVSILKSLNYCKSFHMLTLVLGHLSVEEYKQEINFENLIAAVVFNFTANADLRNFVERYLRFIFKISNNTQISFPHTINELWKAAEKNIAIVGPVLEELVEDNLLPDSSGIYQLLYCNHVEVLRFLLTNKNTNKSELKQILKYSLFSVCSVEMAQLLISFGIDPKQTNSQKETPSQYYSRSVCRDSPLWDVRCFFLKLDPQKLSDSTYYFMTEEVQMSDLVPCQQRDSFEIMYNEQPFKVSNRFFFSLSKIIPMDKKIFNYFLPEEVFLSLSKKLKEKTFYLTFDLKDKVLLAIHNKVMLPPNRTIKYIEGLDNFIASYYHNGNYYAEFSFGKTEYIDHSDNEAEKKYEYRVLLSYPVDGLGNITAYPGFMDLNAKEVFYLCDHNVAHEYVLVDRCYGPFYSTFEKLFPRNRFNYVSILQRLSKIKHIPASINEYLKIDEFIENTIRDDVIANKLRLKMEKHVGDPCAFYNVSSLNNIKVNYRKMLPVGCRVYDLFEFLVKLQQQTNAKILDNLSVYCFLGKFLTEQFDLEYILTWDNFLKIKHNQLESNAF